MYLESSADACFLLTASVRKVIIMISSSNIVLYCAKKSTPCASYFYAEPCFVHYKFIQVFLIFIKTNSESESRLMCLNLQFLVLHRPGGCNQKNFSEKNERCFSEGRESSLF